MSRTLGAAFGIFAIVTATAAYGQEQTAQIPGANGVTVQGQGGRQSTPLFTIGGVNVRLWTPVSPPYNAQANGNLSQRPIWGPG
jgi:hypothetical protein